MRGVDAGVQHPDDDTLAVAGVPPQAGASPQPEKLRSVRGGGAPELVWERAQEPWPLGHHPELGVRQPGGEAGEDLVVGVDEPWLVGASERGGQEGLVPPAVLVLAGVGVGRWLQHHNVCLVATRRLCGILMEAMAQCRCRVVEEGGGEREE